MMNSAAALPFSGFRAIRLQAANAEDTMRRRGDHRYVLRAPSLEALVPDLVEVFDVLEIDGRRAFTRETFFLDAQDRRRDPAPSLRMRCERVTLVARVGGERMTIDHGITFTGSGDEHHGTPQDVFIVETRSGPGPGIADALLRRHHHRPTNATRAPAGRRHRVP
jgi:hypothetical protein